MMTTEIVRVHTEGVSAVGCLYRYINHKTHKYFLELSLDVPVPDVVVLVVHMRGYLGRQLPVELQEV